MQPPYFGWAAISGAALLLLLAQTGACSSGGSATPAPSQAGPPVADGSGEPPFDPRGECSQPLTVPTLRLLTHFEHQNTVRELLGKASSIELAAENSTEGFVNDAELHKVNPLLVRQYHEAARELSKGVESTLAADCSQDGLTCGRSFIETFLARAFRRPALPEELSSFGTLFESSLTRDGLAAALELLVAAVLQSPQFLYRIEFAPGTGEQYRAYDVASRLSYQLWASMPDQALLQAAAAGELTTAEQIEAQAQRLMADARAERASIEFSRRWLNLEELNSSDKAPEVFPEYSAELKQEWSAAIQTFLGDVMWRSQGGLTTLLTTNQFPLSAKLAPLYGLPPSDGMHTFNPAERAGILTHPALTAMLAHDNQSSPVLRGVFVRERILCEELPLPPPGLVIVAPDPSPDATTRERFAVHTENEACSGCHSLIDSLGFAFEHYDALGRFRTQDGGKAVDASGGLTSPNPELAGPLRDAVELAQRLAGSQQVSDCVASYYLRFALGRHLNESDACALGRIQERFRSQQGRFSSLFLAAATSQALAQGANTP
jgi:hypothetical protein